MAELIKLVSPTKGRVVLVPKKNAKDYTAHGWKVVEQKTEPKEADDNASDKSTGRGAVSTGTSTRKRTAKG